MYRIYIFVYFSHFLHTMGKINTMNAVCVYVLLLETSSAVKHREEKFNISNRIRAEGRQINKTKIINKNPKYAHL